VTAKVAAAINESLMFLAREPSLTVNCSA
jgi:hypothetical protein